LILFLTASKSFLSFSFPTKHILTSIGAMSTSESDESESRSTDSTGLQASDEEFSGSESSGSLDLASENETSDESSENEDSEKEGSEEEESGDGEADSDEESQVEWELVDPNVPRPAQRIMVIIPVRQPSPVRQATQSQATPSQPASVRSSPTPAQSNTTPQRPSRLVGSIRDSQESQRTLMTLSDHGQSRSSSGRDRLSTISEITFGSEPVSCPWKCPHIVIHPLQVPPKPRRCFKK
jgi:hypothetical protein